MVKGVVPAKEVALRLLRERFLNRTDFVAVRMHTGKPRPVEANGSLEGLLLGHMGLAGESPKVRYKNHEKSRIRPGRVLRSRACCTSIERSGPTAWSRR